MKTKTSISHLTGKEQEALHNIKKQVIEYLPPLLIFCFDSYSTQSISRSSFISEKRVEEWEFSCNLLIIAPNEASITQETKKEIEELVAPFGKANVFVHTLDFVAEKLNDNNLFFRWVQRNGILLYEKDNSCQKLPAAINMHKEYKEQAEQYFAQNPNFENYLDVQLISSEQSSEESELQLAIKTVAIDLKEAMEEMPLQNQIENLSPEHIANPYLAVNYFCRDFNLRDAKKYLNGWITAVFEKVSWIKKSPADLVYFTERFYQLLEAGWLISQKDNSKRLANLSLQYKVDEIDYMDPVLYSDRNYNVLWEDFPRSLNKKEFINPYRVFSKIFKFQSLDEWKMELRNIYHLALTNIDVKHTGEAINTFGFAKRLNKFVEACQLINVREFEWSDGKLLLKIYNNTPNE